MVERHAKPHHLMCFFPKAINKSHLGMESQPDQTILDSISSGTDITLSTILLYTPNIVDQHVTILYQICHYYQQLFILYI